MKKLHFPEPFPHRHPPVQNVNALMEERITVGQRTADTVARVMGSWRFIIIQSMILAAWTVLNVVAWVRHWDPYPFILLNLVLSLQAAYAAPVIMMSQNRQAARDRLEAHNDFEVNQKAEEEIRVLMGHLEAQNAALTVINEAVQGLVARESGGAAPAAG